MPISANTARLYEPHPLPAPALDFQFDDNVHRLDHLLTARLSLKLQQRFGEEWSLQSYCGRALERIPASTARSLAQCYADVFNESWGENWTLDSALEEVYATIHCQPDYLPIMNLLFREDKVVGFCWAYLLDASALSHEQAPFSSSSLKRHESVDVAKYWMREVGHKQRLVAIRELGVLKEYRQDKTPFLTIPMFEKVSTLDCNVAFFRTRLGSKAFKWSLGVGFVPLQLFMVDDLLLMRGNVRYAMSLLYGAIDETQKRKTQTEIIQNIKRYMCD